MLKRCDEIWLMVDWRERRAWNHCLVSIESLRCRAGFSKRALSRVSFPHTRYLREARATTQHTDVATSLYRRVPSVVENGGRAPLLHSTLRQFLADSPTSASLHKFNSSRSVCVARTPPTGERSLPSYSMATMPVKLAA